MQFWPELMACGGRLFHRYGANNQITICGSCNKKRILELECALEAALKTIVVLEERNSNTLREHRALVAAIEGLNAIEKDRETKYQWPYKPDSLGTSREDT